jgi:hypothetical protein
MKSAPFVQANVAVKTKLTSKVPFSFGNFDVFKKNFVKNVQFRYSMTRKFFFLPQKNFWCPFQYPKVPLEASAAPLPSFDASYAPGCTQFLVSAWLNLSCKERNRWEICLRMRYILRGLRERDLG